MNIRMSLTALCLLLVFAALAADDGGLNLRSLDDIHKLNVGVYDGTVHDLYVAQHYPDARILRYSSVADMVLSLQTGKIDVTFMDLVSAKLLIHNNPSFGLLADGGLDLPLGIGFSKKNPELRQRFNAFLKTIRENGVYDEMHDRWFNDPENTVMPEIELPANGPVLRVAVDVADLPYVAYVNNRYVGIDIEIMSRFAQSEGMSMDIMTINFSSLIAALASGKVDMIADGIGITPERQAQIDFSDPYAEMQTGVIALRKNIAAYQGMEQESNEQQPGFWQKIADSFYSNILQERRYLLILSGLKVTAIISVWSILIGTLLGAGVCLMRMSRAPILRIPAQVFISILRGTPLLVILMIIFYVVFASVNIDPVLVAIISFGLYFAAYVSEMYRSGIQSIDRGQTEAGIAMGFTRFQTFSFIVTPQAVRRILPVYKGEMISLVKMTSIVGYIAVEDLTRAGDIIRSRTFDAFFPLVMVAVLYFVISWLLLVALNALEKRLEPKRRVMGGAA